MEWLREYPVVLIAELQELRSLDLIGDPLKLSNKEDRAEEIYREKLVG